MHAIIYGILKKNMSKIHLVSKIISEKKWLHFKLLEG